MTNKEFQNVLAQYPEDYDIWVDWSFGWEVPSNKHKEDPYMYINSDFGFIEIEPKEYRDIWIEPSERLPKDEEECLVNLRDNTNQVMRFEAESESFRFYNGYDDCNEWIHLDEVNAWMPIPEFEEE